MTPEPPTYIPAELLSNERLTHEWNDWNPYATLPDANPETEAVLKTTSDRAALAFAIGCGEWVVYRFHQLLADARPFAFLEACWAFEMSSEFEAPPESNESDWKGPVRGVVDLALMTILNTIYAMEDGSAHLDAALAEAIALHVLPDRGVFLGWRDLVLARLRDLYSRDPEEPLGEPVAREALDPSAKLDRESARRFVVDFLSRPELSQNVFLKRLKEA